jgi:hypothetical protein
MSAEFHVEHGKLGDQLATIEDDSAAGAQARARLGEALVRGVGRMFRTTGLQIGYRYENSPICVDDGTPPDPDNPEAFVPSTRPGARAPHAWIGEGRSMLDLYGRGFVLLRLGADAPDASALAAAAATRKVPLTTIAVTAPDAVQLYQYRLILVRPDGHVGWRANEMPSDPVAVIDKVRGAVDP